jgi:peptide/nickel transport system substrate-binding protein
VKFTMKQGWANFPISLAAGAGMIADPTLVQSKGKDFNTNPGDAGIGPFQVASFKPGESLVLKKNPNYWNGPVYLDQVTSVLVVGSAAQVQAIQTGTLQGAMVMTPDVVADVDKAKLPRMNFPYYAGTLTMFNGGSAVCTGGTPAKYCTGKPDGTVVQLDTPMKDVRIRKAVAEAVDPNVINQRVYNGALDTYNTLVPPGARYDPKVPGIAYNPDDAKQLVDAAKKDGWDGKLRLVTGVPSQQSLNLLQTYQTLLAAVGITASVETNKTLAQIQVDKDFDVYPAFAWGTSEDRVFEGLYGSLRNYRYGFDDPKMDDAIAKLGVASNDQERATALAAVQTLWNQDVPAAVIGAGYRNFVSSPKLQGIQGTAFQIVDLAKAWLQP